MTRTNHRCTNRPKGRRAAWASLLLAVLALAETGGSRTAFAEDTKVSTGESRAPRAGTFEQRVKPAKHKAPGQTIRFLPSKLFEREGDRIESGVRIAGTLQRVSVARERFMSGGQAHGLALPGRLGGGVLFFQPIAEDGAETAVYRAPSWTGPLTPVGLLPFVAEEVVAGFDRIYLLDSWGRLAIDPDTGQSLSLAPLPPLTTLRDLQFEGGGSALLRAPLVGELVTRDAGLSWKPLPSDGADARRSAQSSGEATSLPLERPGNLREVIVRGAWDASGDVLALVSGRLWRLTAEPLALTSTEVEGLSALARCQGVEGKPAAQERSSLGALFVCQGEATQVFHVLDERKVRLVANFSTGRRVLATGAGGVLVEGGCALSVASGTRDGCLVRANGLTPVGLGKAAPKEVFALGENDAFHVSLTKKGQLRQRRLGSSEPAKLYQVPSEHEVATLIREGTWLRGGSVSERGVSFWSALRESFAGVLLTSDSQQAQAGPIQLPLRRALLSGERGLLWGAAGFTRLTKDGGQSFVEVNFPYRSGDPDPNAVTTSSEPLLLGCGPVGCSLGTWLSWGWDVPEQEPVAPLPQSVPVPPTGAGRFVFDCARTGLQSPPSAPEEDPPADAPQPFWEAPLAPFSAGDEGLSLVDSENLVRMTAWGPRDLPWGARGRTQVHFRRRYVSGPLGASRVTPGLFSGGARAKEALGLFDPATQVVHAELTADEHAGVILVRSRDREELLGFSEGGAVRRLETTSGLDVRNSAGVVERDGRWFLGNVSARRFRVLEFAEGPPTVVLDLEVGREGVTQVKLVATKRGELGIALYGDRSLSVYPLSDSGELGDPRLVPFAGSRPARCAPEASGYLVERELSVAPYVESRGEPLVLRRLRLLMLVGYGEACAEAASAESSEPVVGALLEPGASGLPLLAAEAGPGGRRVELVCQE